jgi:hypothetical protein
MIFLFLWLILLAGGVILVVCGRVEFLNGRLNSLQTRKKDEHLGHPSTERKAGIYIPCYGV